MLVYYINLAGRTDRRAFMEEQFARLGLTATRIEAVTPADVPQADIDAYCTPDRPFWLGIVECACALSHFCAMRELLATGEPQALILEDDLALSDRLAAFLSAIDHSPPDFDLLRIETCEQRLRVRAEGAPLAGVEIVKFLGYDSGAGGYLVSRRGAQRILDRVEARLRPIDQALFDSFAPMARVLVVRQTVPGLCMQSKMPNAGVTDFGSDLGNGDARPAAEAPHIWRHASTAGRAPCTATPSWPFVSNGSSTLVARGCCAFRSSPGHDADLLHQPRTPYRSTRVHGRAVCAARADGDTDRGGNAGRFDRRAARPSY